MNGGSRSQEIRYKVGFYKFDIGHWGAIRNEDAENLWQKHPEAFQMRWGKRVRAKRSNSGCWSSMKFIKYAANKIVNEIRRRELDLVCILPADTTSTRCQCPECTRIPNMTMRWFNCYRKIMTEVRKKCPNIRFVGAVYQDFIALPDKKLPDFEFVSFCSNLRCGIHKLDDPACSDNVEYIRQLSAWGEKARLGTYGYDFDLFIPATTYTPIWNLIENAVRIFRDIGTGKSLGVSFE